MTDEAGSRATATWDEPADAEAATVDAHRPADVAPASSATGERYRLLDELGRGGMAVVHAALDTQLDRRVALKLVRPDRLDGAGRARLLREATALARLRHPNVIQVYDAGTRGDQVFVAMELVEGGSLARWLATGERSRGEILRLFVGAGRGLAAAHAAGLVHRDFKPDNVLVDRGVARVADFGLAVTDPVGTTPATETAPLTSLTQTGAVVGTLAFMAPEQLAGQPATAAADQFAFCVALYRALYQAWPFAGETVAARRAAIEAGPQLEAAPRREVPRWLRDAIARGLAADPAQRHPPMDALVEVLARVRGWRRWRVPLLAATALAAAGGAIATVALGPGPVDPTSRCDGGAAELAAAWGPPRRAAIAAAFARIATPFAEDAGPRVLAALDRQAADWSRRHRTACVAHARGIEPDRALELRMRCLGQRLEALAASTEVLATTTASSVGTALEVIAGLPPLADCDDLEFLTAAIPPPADPGARAAADRLRTRLTGAEILDRAGRSAAALAEMRAILSDADAIRATAIGIDASLAIGRIALAREQQADAIDPLRSAELRAFAAGALGPGIEAAARRLYVEAMLDRSGPALARAEILEPLAAGLRGDRFAQPLLLNNLGAAHLAAGDRERARRYFERAHDVLATIAEPALELFVIDRNLALVSTPTAAPRLARSAWQSLEARLGPSHLSTLEAMNLAAHVTAAPDEALTLVRQFIDRAARFHPDAPAMRADAWSFVGHLQHEVDPTDVEPVRAAFASILALRHDDPAVGVERALAVGQLALLDRDWAAAEAAFAPIIASHADHSAWWERERGAIALVGRATARTERGDRRGAIADLEQAIVRFDESVSHGNNQEPAMRRARAQLALAALVRPQAPARADTLEAAAVAYYRSTGAAAYADEIATYGR